MAFGDVSTPNGLKELNNHLANNSYISGYEPSKSDVEVFKAVGKTSLNDYPHVARWHRHISSFEANENRHWPAGKCVPLEAGGKTTVPTAANNGGDDDDDDVDLFGSGDEEEDAAAAKLREERLAAYEAKKSKKPALIAKSSVLLDVKPWDDETDMKEMERLVRTIEMDGLLWGQSKLAPVGYGIQKLVIMCVIEDEKVSIDLLQEKITEFEDYVQSVDIAAFNKI